MTGRILPTLGELRTRERRAEKRMRAKRMISPPPKPLLRVGVDIDNTMIHNDLVWREFLQRQVDTGRCNHRRPADNEVQACWDYWSAYVCPACFKIATENPYILRAHRLRPDVVRVLSRLTLLGVQFSIITGRPSFTEAATMLWLREKAICPPRIISTVVHDGQKAQTALDLGLDIMLDDSSDVLQRVGSTGKVSTVLMAGTHNRNYRDFVVPDYVANSWRDVENYLLSRLAIEYAMPNYDALDKAILEEKGVIF